MVKCNKDVRSHAAKKGVYLWRAAERVGLSDYKLSRLMRRELSPDFKAKLFEAIDQLATEDLEND